MKWQLVLRLYQRHLAINRIDKEQTMTILNGTQLDTLVKHFSIYVTPVFEVDSAIKTALPEVVDDAIREVADIPGITSKLNRLLDNDNAKVSEVLGDLQDLHEQIYRYKDNWKRSLGRLGNPVSDEIYFQTVKSIIQTVVSVIVDLEYDAEANAEAAAEERNVQVSDLRGEVEQLSTELSSRAVQVETLQRELAEHAGTTDAYREMIARLAAQTITQDAQLRQLQPLTYQQATTEEDNNGESAVAPLSQIRRTINSARAKSNTKRLIFKLSRNNISDADLDKDLKLDIEPKTIAPNTGSSLLHLFISCQKYKFIPRLLEIGVDVNHADNLGNTAVHMLIASNAKESVKLELLDNFKSSGVEFWSSNKQGATALHFAAMQNTSIYTKLAQELPVDALPIVNLADYAGNTALHLACKHNKYDNSKLLLQLGANFSNSNQAGQSCVDIAEHSNSRALRALFSQQLQAPVAIEAVPAESAQLIRVSMGSYSTVAAHLLAAEELVDSPSASMNEAEDEEEVAAVEEVEYEDIEYEDEYEDEVDDADDVYLEPRAAAASRSNFFASVSVATTDTASNGFAQALRIRREQMRPVSEASTISVGSFSSF